MTTRLCTFMNIFDTPSEEDDDTAQVKKIVIPSIQRDYAQGRNTPDAKRVRERFLDALHSAVKESKQITLDFVYGNLDDDGVMTLLDGQQRLTTLFLLHWYAAKKADVPEAACDFLHHFSYETRYSSRDFCEKLVGFTPTFSKVGHVSDEIKDQWWFPFDWLNDPTVASMIVMIDAIDGKFNDLCNNNPSFLWHQLEQDYIAFYFLPIKDMGLTDELYIKMNSRGKPLTDFENFKAELERTIQGVDEDLAHRIMCKLDGAWTDLLWGYRGSDDSSKSMETGFFNYFDFVCMVISCHADGSEHHGDSWDSLTDSDQLHLLNAYFSKENPDAKSNIESLERFFDCWCADALHRVGFDTAEHFQDAFLSKAVVYESGKVRVNENTDVLGDCFCDNKFTVGRQVLLYAFIVYALHPNDVQKADFGRRIRIVVNLIHNSDDELRTEYMSRILAQTRAIILNGWIDESMKFDGFNSVQLDEEKEKIGYLEKHPEQSDVLFKLEDHRLLYGQIGIIGCENLDLAPRFESLWLCSTDSVARAMMATGDFTKNPYRSGNGKYCVYKCGLNTSLDSWKFLFHKKSQPNFDYTRDVLQKLLRTHEEFTDEILNKMADDYVLSCERDGLYPFQYYYVKYSAFRSGTTGRLRCDYYNYYNSSNNYWYPHPCSKCMGTILANASDRLTMRSYLPVLEVAEKLLDAAKGPCTSFDRVFDGDPKNALFHSSNEFIYADVDNGQEVFKRSHYDSNSVSGIADNDTLPIPCNEEGIDTQDRVLFLVNYIEEYWGQ